MTAADIIKRFREYCSMYEIGLGNVDNEPALLGSFVRKDFLNLLSSLGNSPDLDIIHYIEAIFSLADSEKLESNIPFLLIEDLIEAGSYSILEHLLTFLDEKSESWASKLSSKKGAGLILLRSVNLLRRKIVRSQHSKFAGLSLLLLTKIFPASERSGVNLKGERNVDNKDLNFQTNSDQSFYHFCTLHKFFYASPLKLFERNNWHILTLSIEKLFLDIELSLQKENDSNTFTNSDFFSVQHLFTEKSFELQLDVQSFRLTILGQILVLLQDINCISMESSNDKNALKIEPPQEAWIGETTKKAFYLISLHKFGREYFRFLRSIFRNEKAWINWKNSYCPSYEKNFVELPLYSQIFNTTCTTSNYMGNDELRHLWNYSLNDVDNRKLKPDIASYLDKMSPSEDDYIDTNLVWRATRLSWKMKIQ